METKKSYRILFVDNHHKNIKDNSKFLKDLGEFELFFIDEDENIPKFILKNNIDLTIIDITLLRKDGLEICSNLRKNKSIDNIPIILLTKNSDIDSMVTGFKLGANDCIQKPFNTKILISRMNTQIENKLLKSALYNEIENKNDMLLQQSKMAVMGEMIDTIIHQWNEPLTIIDMYKQSLEFILEQKYQLEDETVTKDLDGIRNQVIFLNDTLKEFRDFFRPRKKVQTICLEDVFKSITKLLKDMLIKNNILIEIESSDSHTLEISQNELKHLLINLINNAKDAFRDNNITSNKKVILKSYMEDNNIILSVKDNAGGIPKKIINKIFDSEFTTKKEGKGTGIGLYISSMITAKYNGNISVENEDDGANFRLKFELKKDK